jgi:hypothetical protein
MGWYGVIASGAVATMSLACFLDHKPTLHQVDNGMARQLLPVRLCPPDRPLDRARQSDYESALEQALARLDLVGVQHDLPRFLRQLEVLTGWSIAPVARVNETPRVTVDESTWPLSCDGEALLGERTWLDQWLFTRIHERPELEGLRTDADELFQAALRRFDVGTTPELLAS